MIVTKSKADDLIFENGKVAGVIAGEDKLLANVVIACDGVLSLLAEKAGLRTPGNPKDFAVGVKEVIEIDSSVIEERFGLNEGKVQPVFLWVKLLKGCLAVASCIPIKTV